MDLDQAVVDINRIYLVRALQTVMEVGEYVLDTFFDGEVDAFLGKKKGWESFAELMKRSDLSMSRTVLSTAVSVMLQVKEMPRDLAFELTASHHRALLPVKDMDDKLTLARVAVDKNLSRRKLERLVWDHLGPEGRGKGKRPKSPPAKAVLQIERGARQLIEEMLPGGSWERLSEEEQATLWRKMERVIRALDGVFGGDVGELSADNSGAG